MKKSYTAYSNGSHMENILSVKETLTDKASYGTF